MYFIFTAVAVCRIITEACSSYSMISGFMLRIIFLDGGLAVIIIERVEAFVNGIMLLSFLLWTNFRDIHGKTNGLMLAFLTVLAASAKIVSTVFVSAYYGISTRDNLAFGGLMIMTFLASPIFFLMRKTRKRCNILIGPSQNHKLYSNDSILLGWEKITIILIGLSSPN